MPGGALEGLCPTCIGKVTFGLDSNGDPVPPTDDPVPSVPEIARTDSEPARPWGFWATLGLTGASLMAVSAVVLLFWMVVAAVGGVIGREIPWEHLEQGGAFDPWTMIVSAPVTVGFAWFCASRRPGIRARDYLAMKRAPSQSLSSWCLILVVFLAVAAGMAVALGTTRVPEFRRDAYASAAFVPLFWLAFVVAEPISEEVMFRGFLFRGFESSRLGGTGAIVLSAALWACLYLDRGPYASAQVFAFGLLLGQARLSTGTILVPAVMHVLANLLALIQVAWILLHSPR